MKQLRHQTNDSRIPAIVEAVKTTKKLLMRLEPSKISVNHNLVIRQGEAIKKKDYLNKINTTILQLLTNPNTKEAFLLRLNHILSVNSTQTKSIHTMMNNTIKNTTTLSNSNNLTSTMMKGSIITNKAIHSLHRANPRTEKFTK